MAISYIKSVVIFYNISCRKCMKNEKWLRVPEKLDMHVLDLIGFLYIKSVVFFKTLIGHGEKEKEIWLRLSSSS